MNLMKENPRQAETRRDKAKKNSKERNGRSCILRKLSADPSERLGGSTWERKLIAGPANKKRVVKAVKEHPHTGRGTRISPEKSLKSDPGEEFKLRQRNQN